MEDNANTYRVRLRDKGQVTIPRRVRETLDAAEGDILTLLQVNDLILITPRPSRVAELSDQLTEIMENEGVSLSDLLENLGEIRKVTYEARRKKDA